MKQFRRADRLGELILRELSGLLQRPLAEAFPGLVTLTHVKVSDDVRYARVYFSFLGDAAQRVEIAEYLEEAAGRLRSHLGHTLHIRHAPELSFTYDDSVEHGVRMEQLFEEIKRDRERNQPNSDR